MNYYKYNIRYGLTFNTEKSMFYIRLVVKKIIFDSKCIKLHIIRITFLFFKSSLLLLF